MSQIFNRIWKIIKSNLEQDRESFQSTEFLSEEDELKREIENAWKESKKSKSSFDGRTTNLTIEEAYKILGITPNSTIEEIKIAYKRKVKEYHPDLVQNMGEEIRELAKQKLQEINFAFELIKKTKGF